MNKNTIELTLEEMLLVRDAIIDKKHELKSSPSERGQRLSKLAGAIGETLGNKINHRF